MYTFIQKYSILGTIYAQISGIIYALKFVIMPLNTEATPIIFQFPCRHY